jgi:excisionase family DNA binding protein
MHAPAEIPAATTPIAKRPRVRNQNIDARLANVGTEVLTADEVAVFLRLDRKTVYDYAGRGAIPCQRLGKRILFSRAALVSWLASCSRRSSESDST